MALATPIAFIIFNRSDLTEIVFQAIRHIRPKKLLVIADGPRNEAEAPQCNQTRAIIDQVDWDCEVLKNYSDVNLGCRDRVSSGIDWVFTQVEEAIILEDDCLPSDSFFGFCETMLDCYRDDRRIMMISGDNFQVYREQLPASHAYSYYFSKYVHVWGWATWRRAWEFYDVNMSSWPFFQEENLTYSISEDPVEILFWQDVFDRVAAGAIDTWDYQWVYACFHQSSLSIMPTVNLISNIGFRADATHTLTDSPWANLEVGEIDEIEHPLFTMRDRDADRYTFEKVFGGESLRERLIVQSQLNVEVHGVEGSREGGEEPEREARTESRIKSKGLRC
jgi:hypothetical protein